MKNENSDCGFFSKMHYLLLSDSVPTCNVKKSNIWHENNNFSVAQLIIISVHPLLNDTFFDCSKFKAIADDKKMYL